MSKWVICCWGSPLRRVFTAVGLAALLLGLAELHACACTGGRPVWRPLDTSQAPVATPGDALRP